MAIMLWKFGHGLEESAFTAVLKSYKSYNLIALENRRLSVKAKSIPTTTFMIQIEYFFRNFHMRSITSFNKSILFYLLILKYRLTSRKIISDFCDASGISSHISYREQKIEQIVHLIVPYNNVFFKNVKLLIKLTRLTITHNIILHIYTILFQSKGKTWFFCTEYQWFITEWSILTFPIMLLSTVSQTFKTSLFLSRTSLKSTSESHDDMQFVGFWLFAQKKNHCFVSMCLSAPHGLV